MHYEKWHQHLNFTLELEKDVIKRAAENEMFPKVINM